MLRMSTDVSCKLTSCGLSLKIQLDKKILVSLNRFIRKNGATWRTKHLTGAGEKIIVQKIEVNISKCNSGTKNIEVAYRYIG